MIDVLDRGLSVPGKLRLAAELVSATPGVAPHERADVISKAMGLIQSAQEDLIIATDELHRMALANGADRLLAAIEQRRKNG